MTLALLVETDPALSGLMQTALVRAGFEVRTCEKAAWVRHALAAHDRISNDELLLVLSEHVARAQGVPLLSALQARFRLHSTPLRTLFTTDVASPAPLPRIRELDIAAVLEKPFPLELLERVALRIRLSMAFTLFPDE